MQYPLRPLPFVLVSTNHGMMIVNRHDYQVLPDGRAFGIGHQLFTQGSVVVEEMVLFEQLLDVRRKHFGDGAVILDVGANIGTYTLDLARAVYGWGHVYAYEAQEKIFYTLAGNVIMNNHLNVTARWNAVGRTVGSMKIPDVDYNKPASFASMELKKIETSQEIGQTLDYKNAADEVPMITIDSLNFPRVDLIKIDVEGMEEDVLAGCVETLVRCKPILFVEVIKSTQDQMMAMLSSYGYRLFPEGMNMFAIHATDPVMQSLDPSNQEMHPHSVTA